MDGQASSAAVYVTLRSSRNSCSTAKLPLSVSWPSSRRRSPDVPAHGQQFIAVVHERRPGLALSRDRGVSIQQFPVALNVGVHGAGAFFTPPAMRAGTPGVPGSGLFQCHGDGIALEARDRQ